MKRVRGTRHRLSVASLCSLCFGVSRCLHCEYTLGISGVHFRYVCAFAGLNIRLSANFIFNWSFQ